MDAQRLKEIQAPLKKKYKDQPQSAMVTLKARAKIGDGITCNIETGKALVEAGLHPATGGDGLSACSGDMLLEALVACAGVTLGAVSTAIGVTLFISISDQFSRNFHFVFSRRRKRLNIVV